MHIATFKCLGRNQLVLTHQVCIHTNSCASQVLHIGIYYLGTKPNNLLQAWWWSCAWNGNVWACPYTAFCACLYACVYVPERRILAGGGESSFRLDCSTGPWLSLLDWSVHLDTCWSSKWCKRKNCQSTSISGVCVRRHIHVLYYAIHRLSVLRTNWRVLHFERV